MKGSLSKILGIGTDREQCDAQLSSQLHILHHQGTEKLEDELEVGLHGMAEAG